MLKYQAIPLATTSEGKARTLNANNGKQVLTKVNEGDIYVGGMLFYAANNPGAYCLFDENGRGPDYKLERLERLLVRIEAETSKT